VEGSGIEFDEEQKEYFVKVDFNSIQRFVPNHIYKAVFEDNTAFLFESQIFNEAFFSSTQQMLNMVVEQQSELLMVEEYRERFLEFVERILFDLVAMSEDNKSLMEFGRLL